MTEAEKAYQYFVIAVPESEEQAKAYFWARKALRITLTPPNNPLTLERLREMNGEPVWVEFEDGSGGLWGIVHITIFAQIVFANGLHCTIGERYYGKSYKAYRRPPKGREEEECHD